MKNLFMLSMALFILISANAQSCLPGYIEFSNQAQIDSFQVNNPGCTEIEGTINISGSDISNLNGFNVLTSIGGSIYIYNNSNLTALTGLDNLISVGGSVHIGDPQGGGNFNLTSLTGLEGLTSIGGDLEISSNPHLDSLSALENLTFIGGYLDINDNDNLTSLAGLEGVNATEGALAIYENFNLTSLIGLDNVTNVGGNLLINSNQNLETLSNLASLTSIGGDLFIYFNGSLTNLTGLDHLNSIGGDINIQINNVLSSLTGIDNIAAGSIENLTILNNHSLLTCDVQSICDYLASPNGTIDIQDNATGCASQQEVLAKCIIGLNEKNSINNIINIYPNPSSEKITVELTQPFCQGELTILNLNGRQLNAYQILEPMTAINISHLPAGIYFVRFMSKNETRMFKVTKY